MSAFKNIPSLIGGTAVVAAATIGLTAGPAPASAAPRPSGATIYVFPDPANSANYRVMITGVFPMSEYDAVGFINNINTGEPPGGMPKSALNEDDGRFNETDEILAVACFVDADGGRRQQVSNIVTGNL